MKKVILVFTLVLLSAFNAKAQQAKPMANSVTVVEQVTVERKSVLYKATITLSEDNLYYSVGSYKDLAGLKEHYFKNLKENGIDPANFIEDKLEYISYGYQKDGTVFKFETSSKDEIQKLSQIKIAGVSVTYKHKLMLKPGQRISLKKKVLAKAKENALDVCKAADKKLGEIITITDSNLPEEMWNSLQNNYEEYYYMTVTYEMN